MTSSSRSFILEENGPTKSEHDKLMCLIILCIDVHRDYPLIAAANRDEFYSRPTAPLAFWDDHPEILAGRDLQGRGTWLGVSRSGRIAAVTNYRRPRSLTAPRPAPRSRGILVSSFLSGNISPQVYLKATSARKDQYDAFNLVAGTPSRLWWYSNMNGGIQPIPQGIHGISNHLLDTPWPKLEKAKSGMRDIIAGPSKINPESIFALLSDTGKPPRQSLPDTGVGAAWEEILSSVFVASDVYGTRSSSIILVQRTGRLTFLERTYPGPEGGARADDTRKYELNIEW